MMNESENRRERLLEAALRHVPFDGWTDAALSRAADDLALPAEEARRLFPRGALDAALLFSELADRDMAASYAAQVGDDMRIRDRIALAVRCRFDFLEPHREAVRRLIPFMSLPGNSFRGVRALYRTVDTIWYAIGDRSADFNFYSKRAILAGVISATTLYWLEDQSEASCESWRFLDRRIEDVMRIEKLKAAGRKFGGRLPDPFALLRRARAVRS